jgi:hypothetical protein
MQPGSDTNSLIGVAADGHTWQISPSIESSKILMRFQDAFVHGRAEYVLARARADGLNWLVVGACLNI